MYRRAILSFLFALGTASAFAVPTSDNLSRSAEGYESLDAQSVDELDTNGQADLTLFMQSNSRSSVIAQKRMNNNTLRWFVRGVIGELYHNIFLRQFNRLRGIRHDNQTCRQQCKNEIAIVTGATGGIGSHMAHELAIRGYDVIVAARDDTRGKQLVNEIKERLADIPACKSNAVASEALPDILFVEYHADNPQSALDLASAVKDLNRQVTVLINNAGIMGKSKQLTMKVNLLGPVLLTLALLPLMENSPKDMTVINVGSSAHLRATHVIDEDITLKKGETYINALPNTEDRDLSTYSQSKLALMQFSTLLRYTMSKRDSEIPIIFDAHPGLVWTPLLRNHIGDKATNILHKTGLANLIYKTPLEGAQAIVAAVDYSLEGPRKEQIYFENGQPGGFATHESRDHLAALKLWNQVIQPAVKEWVKIPDELV
jgi:NAD(P)-dependent dehydrogenase (short-subunit alcohol dehydrogenase family)